MYHNEKHESMVKLRADRYKYLWSYEKNEKTLNDKNNNEVQMRVKCLYCGNEYDIRVYEFKKGCECSKCCHFYEDSFAYHLECELELNLYDVWDFKKNILNPYHIYKNSGRKVWIKCMSDEINPINKIKKKIYHESHLVTCRDFSNGNRCPYCSGKSANRKPHVWDSFMYWAVNVIDKEFENKYVSKNNKINLWEYAVQSKVKVEFICQSVEYHDSYNSSLLDFYRKYKEGTYSDCPQCSSKSGKIHPKDSYGSLYPDRAKYWSPRNKKSAFEVAPYSSSVEYWHICEVCGKEFKKRLSKINRKDHKTNFLLCPKCSSKSKLETKTLLILEKYNINYECQKKFDGLIGLGGGNLSYDFYLPDYNVLLETQGQQHEKYCHGFQETYDVFLRQQEHDKRKFEYAMNNNYIPLEVWHWDFDNIEEILVRELELIF